MKKKLSHIKCREGVVLCHMCWVTAHRDSGGGALSAVVLVGQPVVLVVAGASSAVVVVVVLALVHCPHHAGG